MSKACGPPTSAAKVHYATEVSYSTSSSPLSNSGVQRAQVLDAYHPWSLMPLRRAAINGEVAMITKPIGSSPPSSML